MPVLHFQVRRRLLSITRVPESRATGERSIYLQTVIKPLYRLIRDQGYVVVDGRFVRREKDRAEIICYDDVNQSLWYPEDVARIVLNDNASPSSMLLPSGR